MSGYTPLFDSLTKGTLCGRWPDIGLWPIVLSLADKHGIVDVHPSFISGVTGLPVEEVAACLKRFCEPDLRSRSSAENGARLVLLDEHRDWGWQIVNHSEYREKARLMSQNAAQVTDGRNAEKVRKYKERHHKTPVDTAGHPKTPGHTLSNADADSSKRESTHPPKPSRRKTTKEPIPEEFDLTAERRAYAEKHLPAVDAAALMAVFRSTSKAKAWEYADWDQHWQTLVRQWAPDSGHWSSGQYPKLASGPAPMIFAGQPVKWQ